MWRRDVLRAVAVVGAALGIYYSFVLPYRANLVIAAVEQRTMRAQTLDRYGAAVAARANLDDLTASEFPARLNPGWYLLYGANCELLVRLDDAAAVYSRALHIDQRPEIYVNLGLVMLELGRTEEGIHDLVIAARFKPDILDTLNGDVALRVAAAAGIH